MRRPSLALALGLAAAALAAAPAASPDRAFAQEAPGAAPAPAPPPAAAPPAPPAAAPPAAVDLRPRLEAWGLPVRGQHRRPTCSVFTVVVAMEYAVARARGRGEPLSVEFANWAGNEATRRVDDGSFFSDVWEGYEAHGICPDRLLPYGKSFDPQATPPDAAREAARALRASVPLRIHWIAPLPKKPGITDAHLAEIKAVLAAGWPVCGGSYHSVLFVGYRDDPEEAGGGVLIVRDSGGAGGHGTISYEAAKARFGDVLWIEAVSP